MNGGTRSGVRAALARWRGRDIELKSPGEIDAMRVAGALVAQTLAAVTAAARPGVSTGELDAIAEQVIRDGGGVPSFLGYHGYPASICASVNENSRGRPSTKTAKPPRSSRNSSSSSSDQNSVSGIGG